MVSADRHHRTHISYITLQGYLSFAEILLYQALYLRTFRST